MKSRQQPPTPVEELDQDRRVERRMLWKGVLSALLVVVTVLIRQRYWI